MTLEELGFVREPIENRFVYKRTYTFIDYHEWIEFYPTDKDFDLQGIDTIDMMLLEAIYNKAKELFEWLKNIKKY